MLVFNVQGEIAGGYIDVLKYDREFLFKGNDIVGF